MSWPGSGGYEKAMKISSLSLVGIKNIFVKCKVLRIEYMDVYQPQPQKAWKLNQLQSTCQIISM